MNTLDYLTKKFNFKPDDEIPIKPQDFGRDKTLVCFV